MRSLLPAGTLHHRCSLLWVSPVEAMSSESKMIMMVSGTTQTETLDPCGSLENADRHPTKGVVCETSKECISKHQCLQAADLAGR